MYMRLIVAVVPNTDLHAKCTYLVIAHALMSLRSPTSHGEALSGSSIVRTRFMHTSDQIAKSQATFNVQRPC